MTDFWRDLRYGIRSLLRKPTFTLPVVLSLGLGIGLNTAIFSFVNQLFLRPLPGVENPQSIVAAFSHAEGGPAYLPISHLNYKDLREQSRSFTDLCAAQGIAVGIAGSGEAESLSGEMVTANYFDTLGAGMLLGRSFLPEEDENPGTHPVVILSHRLWRERFGADSSMVGRKIILNGRPFTVVGVADSSFRGTSAFGAPALWLPTMMYRTVFIAPDLFEQRGGPTLQVYGRLRPGVTIAAAEAELRTLAARLERAFPEDNRGQSISLVSLSQATIHPSRRSVFVRAGGLLMSVVALLLLITCFNVANLLLVRVLERSRELALRLSLGAGRRHLMRQLLTESLLLALSGGALGLLIAGWAWKLLWVFRPPSFAAEAMTFSLDARVLCFALAACLLTGVLFGLAPMLWITRANLALEIRPVRPFFAIKGHRVSAGDLFVILQVAFCGVAITGAGIFLKSLWNAQQIDPGFSTSNLLIATFDLQSLGYDESRGQIFQAQLLAQAAALPGVESAALGENRPLGGFRLWRSVLPLDSERRPEDAVMVGSSRVGIGYFDTMGISLVAGRAFQRGDQQGAPAVAVINESLRRRFWPDRNPVGLRVRLDEEEEPVEIIGVVRDSKYMRIGEDAQPFLYVPLAQRYSSRAALHLRTSGKPEGLAAAVRREAARLESSLPLNEVRTIEEILDQSLWMPRMIAALLSLLGLLALALSSIGVYGVTAHAVAKQRFEIGVRMALGAKQANVVGLLLQRGLAVLAVGLALGIVGGFLLNRSLTGLLYGAEIGDPATFASALLVLLMVGVLATLIPALRAARINPVTALRSH